MCSPWEFNFSQHDGPSSWTDLIIQRTSDSPLAGLHYGAAKLKNNDVQIIDPGPRPRSTHPKVCSRHSRPWKPCWRRCPIAPRWANDGRRGAGDGWLFMSIVLAAIAWALGSLDSSGSYSRDVTLWTTRRTRSAPSPGRSCGRCPSVGGAADPRRSGSFGKLIGSAIMLGYALPMLGIDGRRRRKSDLWTGRPQSRTRLSC